MSKRVVTKIEPEGFHRDGQGMMKIIFTFAEGPCSVIEIRPDLWIQILESAKEAAPHVSWNELKNQIYYSVVMGAAEVSTLA